jgi:hypothetical protein
MHNKQAARSRRSRLAMPRWRCARATSLASAPSANKAGELLTQVGGPLEPPLSGGDKSKLSLFSEARRGPRPSRASSPKARSPGRTRCGSRLRQARRTATLKERPSAKQQSPKSSTSSWSPGPQCPSMWLCMASGSPCKPGRTAGLGAIRRCDVLSSGRPRASTKNRGKGRADRGRSR